MMFGLFGWGHVERQLARVDAMIDAMHVAELMADREPNPERQMGMRMALREITRAVGSDPRWGAGS